MPRTGSPGAPPAAWAPSTPTAPNSELQTKTGSATGAQTRYQYDALGNLLKVVLPTGDSVEYLIDGQNRRVGRKWNGAVTTAGCTRTSSTPSRSSTAPARW
ncbi:MAG: RHS repeat protein [Gemmatimonadetes bacterium]|nr:RHS repeat protein [Gemmatimonadota bacterium]